MLPPDLARRYVPLRPLGAGGMGTVVLAEDRELGRRVAVKLMLRPDQPGPVARFRREARAMAAVEHPHVARLLDFGVVEDQLYMVLEYVEGRSPTGALPDPLPPMLEVASALEAAHAAGVLHRDVKPSNLVLRPDGGMVLIDFGLASQADQARITATGAVVGTPAFLAPELLLGEAASPASDFYSWGATLYALLEGRHPVASEQIYLWAAEGVLEMAWERCPEGSPMQRLVRRCMAHDPERRPTNRAQLEAVLAGGSVDPEAPTASMPAPLPVPATAPSKASTGPRSSEAHLSSPASHPGRGRRALGLGLLLLGGISLGFLGRFRGAPRSPQEGTLSPASPAEPTPEAARFDHATADLARHFGWGAPGRQRDPTWVSSSEVRAALPALGDVRLPPKLLRTAAAAAAWLSGADLERPEEAARFRDGLTGTFLHAMALYRGIERLHRNSALAVLETGQQEDSAATLELDYEELKQAVQDAVSQVRLSATGEARLVLDVFAATVTPQRAPPELVPRLLQTSRTGTRGPLFPSLAIALDFATLHVTSLEELPCSARVAAAHFRQQLLVPRPPDLELREYWSRLLQALHLEVKLDRGCRPDDVEERAAAVRTYLDQVELHGDQAPEVVGTGLAATVQAAEEIHFLFEDPRPWLQEAMRRVRLLARRFPPPARPPGAPAP